MVMARRNRSLDIVHRLNGIFSILVSPILDEAESTAATSVTVFDDDLQYKVSLDTSSILGGGRESYSFFDCTKLFELLAKSIVVGVPCKATNPISEWA